MWIALFNDSLKFGSFRDVDFILRVGKRSVPESGDKAEK